MAITWAVLLFHLPTFADQDPRVEEALYRLSREASQLWQTAPGFIARETVNQKALAPGKNRVRFGVGTAATGKAAPGFQNREIVSYYALGGFKGAPEALREFRRMYSVDGKPVDDEKTARSRLAQTLASADNAARQDLIGEFEKACVSGAATDFGQVILLFTKPNLRKYSFEFAGDTRVGVDSAWQIAFKQQAGSQSLHILEGKKKMTEKLEGEIWVRQGDFLPLRILLNSSHARDKNQIRDEAKVDYTVVSGALLPAALTYRRFVNDELVLESVYRYSDWQPVGSP